MEFDIYQVPQALMHASRVILEEECEELYCTTH